VTETPVQRPKKRVKKRENSKGVANREGIIVAKRKGTR